jgi:ketosteroid isomerase-like protein
MAGRDHRQALYKFITWTREAFHKRDLEAYVSQYTDDAIYMWPDGPPIEGSVALRRFFKERFAEFDAMLENETLETNRRPACL